MFADHQHRNSTADSADNWFNASDRLNTTHQLLNKPPKPQRPGSEVRVCIIDTGFDGLHPFLFAKPFGKGWGARIRGCISFDGQKKEVVEPDWTAWKNEVLSNDEEVPKYTGYRDDDGHGTHCAGLVLQTAPHAHIYIAKVGTGRNHVPDPDLIAQVMAIDSKYFL